MLLISTPFSMYLIYLRALFVPFLRARTFVVVILLLNEDCNAGQEIFFREEFFTESLFGYSRRVFLHSFIMCPIKINKELLYKIS